MSIDTLAYHLTSTKTLPNKPMREMVVPFFLQNNVKTVLDYGCGRFLRDSTYLAEHGLCVDAVDLGAQIARIPLEKMRLVNTVSTSIHGREYDAGILNFILQVIPTPQLRDTLLSRVCESVRDDGYLVVSLRSQKDMEQNVIGRGTLFNDGYLMQIGARQTFVRGYERQEVEEMHKRFNLDIVDMASTSHSYITLSKKQL